MNPEILAERIVELFYESHFIDEDADTQKMEQSLKKFLEGYFALPILIEGYKRHFNNFKTTQDRKYVLYDFFGRVDNLEKSSFKITKYIGSNQVILEKHGKELYNSDKEGKINNPTDFEKFFYNVVSDLLVERRIKA